MSTARGFSLIESLVALAVTGIVLVAASQVANYVNSQVQRTVAVYNRKDLLSEVRDQVSFANRCSTTLGWEDPKGGVAMHWPAVPGVTDWMTTQGQEIRIYIPGIKSGRNLSGTTISSSPPDNILPLLGAKIYSLRLQEGFPVPMGGLPAGETQYIAKLVMQVGPIAPAANELQISPPVVLTTLTLDIASGGTAIDPNAVAGDILDCPPNGVTQSPQVVCTNFGCTYHPDGSCTCPNYLAGCSDPFQIIVGVDASGVLNCQYPANGSCGPNTYLSGIVANSTTNPPGKLVCTSYIDGTIFTGASAAMCPQTSTWNWSVGANACTGTYNAPANVAIGTNVTVTDGANGSATFNCAAGGTWQVANNPAATCL